MPDEHVLVVEDDLSAAALAAKICRDERCRTSVAHTVAAAVEVLAADSPSVLILDLSLPDGDGVEVLRQVRLREGQISLILTSGFDDKVLGTVRQLAEKLGLKVIDDIPKPFPVDRLRRAVERALASQRALSAADLEQAIAQGQLDLAYQPKVDLSAPDFAVAPAVEALVRWNHPFHGEIQPFRFLPLAVESGQMRALTCSVIEIALRQMAIWKETGTSPRVSINLAPELLDDRRLPDEISDLARQSGVAPSQLGFEITETAATAYSELVLDIATRFRLLGMSLSIDDFGTGYSSLRHLYLLPFNELKIDISFVAEMRRRQQARTLVKASIDLAHNLGMRACAEGVEDFETLSMLHEMGCDAAQGYFISRPLPAQRLDVLMRGWRNPFAV